MYEVRGMSPANLAPRLSPAPRTVRGTEGKEAEERERERIRGVEKG